MQRAGQRSRQTFASPSRVRWSRRPSTPPSSWRAQASPTTHKARCRSALSALWPQLSGRRHGRWCRVRAAFGHPRAADALGSRPSDLFDPYVTQMCHIFTQRATLVHAATMHARDLALARPRATVLHTVRVKGITVYGCVGVQGSVSSTLHCWLLDRSC